MTSSANQVDPFTRPFDTYILTSPANQAYFQNMLHATFQQFLPLRNQPATQLATKQEQQAIAEDFTESTTESATEKKSTASDCNHGTTSVLSKIPAQATMQVCREHAVRLSNAPFLVSQHTRLLDSQHASFLASQLASPPGYIRHAKDMEATGQG